MDDELGAAEKARRREAEEFGCYGLVGGAARQLRTHNWVRACEVTKQDGPFYCGRCYSDAIVRKCDEKVDHFAHEAPRTAAIGAKEGELHLACKRQICAELAAGSPDGSWEAERTIPANAKRGIREVRPDISGRLRNGRVAVEVQASALSITSILKRTLTYTQRRIPVLWVVPLHAELPDAQFRPRLYERYFQSIYFGRTYYWWPGLGASVMPVHYGIAKRHIPYAEWYEQGGEHIEVGGYEVDYKAIKRPVFGPLLKIDNHFAPHRRDAFTPENERKAVPECDLWFDHMEPWW
ncbi:competence protein CoiA family protein [Ramlibacter sp.]|uniref:competence protein CoiA family protein n=1 Tax=Ramlibacter sp. TaxID=1917967 RepID=UPI002636DBD3|nr:competence protein CoiA family protein [Ramlibacter sp.]MDB5957514.1 competence protein CoiA [Ramlibacter sp.]